MIWETRRQCNGNFGLQLWNQYSALPAVSPPVISHQAASQYSTHELAVRNLEDLVITTLKPLLGPDLIPHAVPINRHSWHHFGSLLDHNPHGRHLWTPMTLTLLAGTIAYTGKENSPLIPIPGPVRSVCILKWQEWPFGSLYCPSAIALPIWQKRKTKISLPVHIVLKLRNRIFG